MIKWYLVNRWIKSQFHKITGFRIFLLLLGYMIASWLLLYSAGETELISTPSNFIYYLSVTGSTVGYGDLTPKTSVGKAIVALFVIPIGLSLFAVSVGRLASAVITYSRQGLLGYKDIDMSGHIFILGWNEQRTIDLIKMLLHEEKSGRQIVLCVRANIENPMPKHIEFVRTPTFTDKDAMGRAGLERADCIIIDNPEDDITFATALFCASKNPKAHILAYFQDDVLSQLLKFHCPNAEVIPSVSIEMLAKSAIDPGSSELHHELLSAQKGMTQYTVLYPADAEVMKVGTLFLYMKEKYDSTLIAIRHDHQIQLNPALDDDIYPEDLLFYIADQRVNNFAWPKSS